MKHEDGKINFVMVGGFLGSGKSTAILKLARHYMDNGLKVGVITNDQSVGLVDTELMTSHGLNVEEIPCGCFCCNFNNLVDAAKKLTLEEKPDVFLAEPVGSCTDLVATVSYPLRQLYSDYRIAPLTVLLDPYRGAAMAGLLKRKNFSDKVLYVFRKQLEEADIIVVNKVDLLGTARGEALLEKLLAWLRDEFPGKFVHKISARQEIGIAEWVGLIDSEESGRSPLRDIDYELYAEGEALMGWLNASVSMSSKNELDGNRLLDELAGSLLAEINSEGGEVAHLKMTMKDPTKVSHVAAINVVENCRVPEFSIQLPEPVAAASIIVNVRAEVHPDRLSCALAKSIERVAGDFEAELTVDHQECFQPAKPTPTHRVESL